tara:strand:+ start:1220 stop:1549 length:330 start_codon:yes stop_codon:yes gene_type:complete
MMKMKLKEKMEELTEFFIRQGKVFSKRDWTTSGHQALYKELIGPSEYKNFVYTASRTNKVRWNLIGKAKPLPAKKVQETPVQVEPVEAQEQLSPLERLRQAVKSGESSE